LLTFGHESVSPSRIADGIVEGVAHLLLGYLVHLVRVAIAEAGEAIGGAVASAHIGHVGFVLVDGESLAIVLLEQLHLMEEELALPVDEARQHLHRRQ
jgi:uncharacterized protein (DUF697 family)